MAKQGKITRDEVIDKKVLSVGTDYAKSLLPAIQANQAWLESFENIGKYAKEWGKFEGDFKGSKNRKEFVALLEKEEKLRRETANALKAEQQALLAQQKVQQALIDTDKKELQLEQAKQRAKNKTKKLTIEERTELRLLNKGRKEAQVISSKLSTAYEKQAAKLVLLRREYKNVAIAKGTTSKEARKLQAQIQKLDTTLKRVDANVGQFQRNVGNYGKALHFAKGAARELASAMGLVGGAFLGIQVARDAIKVIKDFEKQNATLSAILQVENEEMQDLRQNSIDLGSSTVKTASQVTELQIAYARLGFSQKEILDLTEATIQGSIAMNAELDKTAELTGAVINTFSEFDTTDAPKVIDIMSLATAKSALNFEKLEKGIPIVAGAANAANIPFTRLVALMGKLSDSGIDISTSSTSLRNIFIESAKQGLNYAQIVQKIKDSQDKLTASNDEFGKRAAVSAAVLSENIDQTVALDEALQSAAGTAQSMADKELDTLEGSLQLLRSAWEGYILGVDESNEISKDLKDAVKFLAENLSTMLNFLFKTAKAWLFYKGILLAVSVTTRVYTTTVIALRVAKIALSRGINGATVAMKGFNVATKANPIGALLSVVAAGVATWLAFRDGVKSAAEELAEVKSKAIAARDAIVEANLATVKNRLSQIEAEADGEKEVLDRKIAFINQEIDETRSGKKILQQIREESAEKEKEIEEDKVTDLEELNKRLEDYKLGSSASGQEGLPSSVSETTSAKQVRVIDYTPVLNKNAQQKTVDELEKLLGELQKQKLANEKKNQEELRKLNESELKKRAKDAFNLNKELLQIEIDNSEEIRDNEEFSFALRQLANKNYYDDKLRLLDLEKDYAIKNAEGRTDEIKRIEAAYNHDVEKLERDRAKKSLDLLKKNFQEQKKLIQKSKQAKEDELQNEIASINEVFNQSSKTQSDIEQREEAIAQVVKRFALEKLNAQIAAIEELLKEEGLSIDQRNELAKQLRDLKIEYSRVETDQIKEDLQEQLDAEQLLRDRKLEFLSEYSSALAQALGVDSQLMNDFVTGLMEGFDSSTDAILTGIQTLSAVTGSILSQTFNNNIAKIDEQIAKNDEYYNHILDNENLSARTRAEIEEKAERDRQKLEKKKREEKRKQAVANKAFAVADIAINTARAIVGIWAEVPKFDFGISAGLLTGFVSALGAIQAAAVLATKIPQFAEGHLEGTYEGPAITNDAVRNGKPVQEVWERNGKAQLIQGKNTLIHMKRGDRIYKSKEDYERLMRASALTSIEADQRRLNEFQVTQVFDNHNEELLEEMRLTRKAMEKKQPIIINNKTDVASALAHAMYMAQKTDYNA